MTHLQETSPDALLPELPGCPPPTSAARRRILGWLGGLFGAVAAVFAGVPIIGYLFSPLTKRPGSTWLPLGKVDDFAVGATQLVTFKHPDAKRIAWSGEVANTAAYVRRISPKEFQVFAVNCTHLGCPVSWFPQSGLFMCPCHGGVYYENGDHASGPPPRPLYQYSYQIVKDQLEGYIGHMPTLQDPPDVPKTKA